MCNGADGASRMCNGASAMALTGLAECALAREITKHKITQALCILRHAHCCGLTFFMAFGGFGDSLQRLLINS